MLQWAGCALALDQLQPDLQGAGRQAAAPSYAAFHAKTEDLPRLAALLAAGTTDAVATRMAALYRAADLDGDERLMLDETVAFFCAAVDTATAAAEAAADSRYAALAGARNRQERETERRNVQTVSKNATREQEADSAN